MALGKFTAVNQETHCTSHLQLGEGHHSCLLWSLKRPTPNPGGQRPEGLEKGRVILVSRTNRGWAFGEINKQTNKKLITRILGL